MQGKGIKEWISEQSDKRREKRNVPKPSYLMVAFTTPLRLEKEVDVKNFILVKKDLCD